MEENKILKIKEVYERLNTSEKESLLNVLGISKKTMYNWINRHTSVPSDSLIKIRDYFNKVLEKNYTLEDLLSDYYPLQ